VETAKTSKPNFDQETQLRIMKEISNDACVEISRLSTEGPQKPDDDN
jgi:hypothetical protein